MDRRDELRNVPHIGGAADDQVTADAAAECFGVFRVEVEQRRVGTDCRIRFLVELNFHSASGRVGGTFGAALNDLGALPHISDGATAHVPHELGASRDNVRRAATFGDNTVNLLPWLHLLAGESDGVEGEGCRVECVDALFWGVGCVRVATGEGCVRVRAGQRQHRVLVFWTGVDHERGVQAIEGAFAQHGDLAALVLFGGGAEQSQGDAELVDERYEGCECTECGGGDDVVPTGVADFGEGVVFGAQGHHEVSGTDLCQVCGWQATVADLPVDAGQLADSLGELGDRFVLFESDLGVVGEPVAAFDELRCQFADAFGHAVFVFCCGHRVLSLSGLCRCGWFVLSLAHADEGGDHYCCKRDTAPDEDKWPHEFHPAVVGDAGDCEAAEQRAGCWEEGV